MKFATFYSLIFETLKLRVVRIVRKFDNRANNPNMYINLKSVTTGVKLAFQK